MARARIGNGVRGEKMKWDWSWLNESALILDGLQTALLLAVILTIRAIIVRTVMKNQMLPVETRRRWAVNLRTGLAFTFLIGVIFIWAHELNALAVSLVAIAVALVLATKELILCISGTVLRLGAGVYTLGDRIEIAGIRGNVLDQTLLATTVLEIGPGHKTQQYTGRVVFFPNSLLLSAPLINETYMKDYIVHVLTIPLGPGEDWVEAEKILLEAARAECDPFVKEAERYMKMLEGKNWLDAPSVYPRVTIQIPEPGIIHLILRVPTPSRYTSRVEQAIIRRFLLKFPVTGGAPLGPKGPGHGKGSST